MRTSLIAFTRGLAKIFRFTQRTPVLTVGLVVFTALIAASHIPSQQHLISYRDLFDQKFESAKRFNETRERFSLGNEILLFAKPKSGEWDDPLLCDYKNWIVKEKANHPEIDSATSVFDLRETARKEDSIQYPPILKLDCANLSQLKPDFSKLEKSFWNKTLYSKNSNDLAVQFSFRDTPGGSLYGKFDPHPIGETIESFRLALGDKLEDVWTGPSMYEYFIRSNVTRTRSLNVIVLLILFFLYRAFLGTWRAGFLMTGTLFITGMLLYGGMAWTGTPLDLLSTGIFLMITISAHQDFSYLSSLKSQSTRPLNLFRRFLIPSFFTSLTTVIGFASLGISQISMIARFGLWAAGGALLEWFMILIFLPATITLMPSLQNWVDEKRIWIKNPLQSTFWKKITPSIGVSRLLLFVFLLVPISIHFTNFSDDSKDLFESNHSFRKALAYVLQSRGWDQDLSLVFTPDQPEAFKQKIISHFAQDKLVAKIDDPENLTRYFESGLLPLEQNLVDRELRSTGTFDRYQSKTGESRVIFYMNSTDQTSLLDFKNRIEAECAKGECYVTGPVDLYNEFVFQVSRTLVESLILSLFFVILIMTYLIRARGVPYGFLIIVSSLWGPAVMLIIIAVFQVSINAFTSSFAAVVVGLAGDNAIQFVFAYRKRDLLTSIHSRGDGAFFTSVVMALCSLTFLGAAYHPPKVMGVLLFFCFMLNFYGDYAILSGLIQKK